MNEYYGKTVGGAASCYIVRHGTAEELERFHGFLRRSSVAFELSREGLWDEVEAGTDTIIRLFQASDRSQRRDTLEIAAIELSEGSPIEPVVDGLLSTDMLDSERSILSL